MALKFENRSPSVVRGFSLCEETTELLAQLEEHYRVNASALVRELIRQEHRAVFELADQPDGAA